MRAANARRITFSHLTYAGLLFALTTLGWMRFSTANASQEPVAKNFAKGVCVLTYHNDNERIGANTNETMLTLANVNAKTFGLLMKYPLDGYVYSQPLYFHGMEVPGKGKRNVVFVTTANNSVYALDADSNAGPDGGILWHDDLGGGIDLVQHHEFGGRYHNNVFQDMLPQIGITGTPVIDPVSRTLYVDAFTRSQTDVGPIFHHRIHALNLTDGTERTFSPVEVTASVPGTGVGSLGGVVQFDPRQQIQRPALTLAGGILYVAYGSAADTDPYHGWILGFNASNLQPLSNYDFNTTPNATVEQFGQHAGEGALWMAGDGLCVDANTNLFFAIANGSFDADRSLGNGADYGDSLMKLSTSGKRLEVADYFTPYNQAEMQADDADFGSGGVLLLPEAVGSLAHPRLAVAVDKSSTIYLVDRDNLGHFNRSDNHQIVQEVQAATGRFFSTPAYFNYHLYCQGIGGMMKAYAITNGHITPTPESMTLSSFSGAGTTPSVSANGRCDGIVWTIQTDGAVSGRPAILHAYNATNLAVELYSSSQLPARDNPGDAVKMTVPTVADGRVFVGTQNGLAIFGTANFLNPPVIAPAGGDFKDVVKVALTDSDHAADIFYTLDGTVPTTRSKHYGMPFIMTHSSEVRALAVKPGSVDSSVAAASFVNTSQASDGTGLLGQYWANIGASDFTNETFSTPPTLTQVEAVVDFHCRTNTPAFLGHLDHLIARWSGAVRPQYTDHYELAVVSEGSVRCWLNSRLLVNNWMRHASPVTNLVAVNLDAQEFYNVQLECAVGNGDMVRLLWRRGCDAFEVIPQTQLFSRLTPAPTLRFLTPTENSRFSGCASLTAGVEAKSAFNQIAKVEFFANDISFGSVSRSIYSPIYAVTTTGLEPGHYTLTAVATDGSGLCSISAPIHVIVAPGSGQSYGLTNRADITPYLKMPASFNDPLPPLLSGTGVFANVADRTPAAGLIPYCLNVPMWSDGAIESNHIALPYRGDPITPEEQLRLHPTGFWKFPDGTVFIKSLDLVVDETNANVPRRRLETQILVRDDSGGVYGATYKWRRDNLDAELVTASVSEDILITNNTGVRTQTWTYASPADCLTCHTPGAGYVLGVNTRQLNGNLKYSATGVTDNQIRTWNRLGMFCPAIDAADIPSFSKLSALTDMKAPLEQRVRSYLDANCAECHRPGGAGNYDARYDTPLTRQKIVDAPAAVTLGLTDARIVRPGDTVHSVLYQRINATNPAVKMPPLSHDRVDARAVRVFGEWIERLPMSNAN
jgi:hypothetical protein